MHPVKENKERKKEKVKRVGKNFDNDFRKLLIIISPILFVKLNIIYYLNQNLLSIKSLSSSSYIACITKKKML